MNCAVSFTCVAVGGALGASMRYAISLLLLGLDSRFPWATLTANISGAFLAGLLVTWLTARGAIGTPAQLLFVVGFLGSFTTLSAFSIETLRMLQAGEWFHASLNFSLTFFGSLLAAYLGYSVFRTLAS